MPQTSDHIAAADLVVVGGGIVGMAHALEAAERGLSVVVVERDERAVGASVRNFGHLIVHAMAAGEPLACALDARERWLWLGREAGLEVVDEGSVIVARHDDEMDALEEVARAEPERGTRLLSRAEVGRLAPIPTTGLVGGLHAELDLRVDPRTAVGALADWLAERYGVTLAWAAAVRDVDLPLVRTTRGLIRAEMAIVCPGPDYTTLFPEVFAARAGLTRTKLQMMRVAAPEGRRYGPALLTSLSLIHYPGLSAHPSVARVRARVESERPELLRAGVNLIVTQLPDGDLVIGDTHEYDLAVSPFGDERLDALVLGEAAELLGVERLEVRERWHGVYPNAPGDPFLVASPAPGVRVVEVVAGVGMTTALGLAPRVLDDLLRASATAA